MLTAFKKNNSPVVEKNTFESNRGRRTDLKICVSLSAMCLVSKSPRKSSNYLFCPVAPNFPFGIIYVLMITFNLLRIFVHWLLIRSSETHFGRLCSL